MKKIAALILSLTMVFFTLTALSSCSAGDDDACSYLETRDLTGRDIKYVEIRVQEYGKIVVLLDATTAPITVANFINLVESGFYDGLTFHRVISGFMIQGGDPEGTGRGGAPNKIEGEFSSNGHPNDIKHIRGVISMARSSDPNSASSQFFICHDTASNLDGDYAAFGYVVEGLSVVDEIISNTLKKCENYFGDYDFNYWFYYGNGSLVLGSKPIQELQPVIKSIKVLDSWKK